MDKLRLKVERAKNSSLAPDWNASFAGGRSHYRAEAIGACDGAWLAIGYLGESPVIGAMLRRRGFLGLRVDAGIPNTLSGPYEMVASCSQRMVADFFRKISRRMWTPFVCLRGALEQDRNLVDVGLGAADYHYAPLQRYSSIEEFIADQSYSRRKRLRRILRDAGAKDVRFVVEPLASQNIDEIRPLYEKWCLKYNNEGADSFDRYLDNLRRGDSADQLIHKLYFRDELVAFDLVSQTENEVEATMTGFDYEKVGRRPAYEMLYLVQLKRLFKSKYSGSVKLGQGSDLAKKRLGTVAEPRMTGLVFAWAWVGRLCAFSLMLRSNPKGGWCYGQ